MTPVLVVVRGPHELVTAARTVDCHRCHAGDACVTDENGVHLARMATAARLQVITKVEFLAVIPDDFTPTTVVEDPGSTP